MFEEKTAVMVQYRNFLLRFVVTLLICRCVNVDLCFSGIFNFFFFFLGICPDGHYCPQGTADPIGCAAGTYNDLTNQAACFTCAAGYYCLANSTTYVNTPCPKGKV